MRWRAWAESTPDRGGLAGPGFGRGQRERFRGVKSGRAVGLAEQEGPGGAQLQMYWVRDDAMCQRPLGGAEFAPPERGSVAARVRGPWREGDEHVTDDSAIPKHGDEGMQGQGAEGGEGTVQPREPRGAVPGMNGRGPPPSQTGPPAPPGAELPETAGGNWAHLN